MDSGPCDMMKKGVVCQPEMTLGVEEEVAVWAGGFFLLFFFFFCEGGVDDEEASG